MSRFGHDSITVLWYRRVILENRGFFDKIWAWEMLFFAKNWKKMTSYWLFGPIINSSFDRIDVFWPNMGLTAGDFHEKMTSENSVFKRVVWPIIECSFDRIYVFLTNHMHESREFFMKKLKKRDMRAPCFETKSHRFWGKFWKSLRFR